MARIRSTQMRSLRALFTASAAYNSCISGFSVEGGNRKLVGRGMTIVFERSRERLCFGIHAMTNRPALHHDDGMMPVLALRRGGQARDVTRLHLPQYLLETHRRKVMAFIHNDVAVVCDEVVHDLFAVQALNDGNVNHAAGTSPTAADLAD